ncbi:MAG: hypothetical protein R3Y13_01745 [bacterium]
MQEMLHRMYEIENFTTYISIIIAVLLVLFILVLFLGKKDQKLEETKRLQKIEMDAFKENNEAKELEIPKENKVEGVLNAKEVPDLSSLGIASNEKTPDIFPSIAPIDETNVVEETEKASDVLENTLNSIRGITSGNNLETDEKITTANGDKLSAFSDYDAPYLKEDTVYNLPKMKEILDYEQKVIQEVKSEELLQAENLMNQQRLEAERIEREKLEMEKQQKEKEVVKPEEEYVPVDLSKINVDEIVPEPLKKRVVGAPVFSSVYAPKKEDEIIDLTKVNEPKETSKEEYKGFDQIVGETYNIRK